MKEIFDSAFYYYSHTDLLLIIYWLVKIVVFISRLFFLVNPWIVLQNQTRNSFVTNIGKENDTKRHIFFDSFGVLSYNDFYEWRYIKTCKKFSTQKYKKIYIKNKSYVFIF